MRRSILFLSLGLLLAFLVSCSTKIPKVPVCTELSLSRAYCVNTVTSEEFYFDDQNKFEGKTYWEARPTMLMIPASSWEKIKVFIIEVCKKTKKCDTEIATWERTVNGIDTQIKKKQ